MGKELANGELKTKSKLIVK